jgi:cell division protease FtsH
LPHAEHDYGEATADAIDSEVRAIVDRALERTLGILRERREALERTARRLLETETLDEADLVDLVGPPVAKPKARGKVEIVPIEPPTDDRPTI